MTTITTTKNTIYIFSQEFRNKFSATVMEQQNLLPICIKQGKQYFYSNEEQILSFQNVQNENIYIKITEPILGVKTYPITEYLFQAVNDGNTDIHITIDKLVIKKQGITSKLIRIDEREYNEIKNFLRMFCDLNIFSTKDESTIMYTRFLNEKIGVRVSLFPSEQNALISLRFIYKDPILLGDSVKIQDLSNLIRDNQLTVIGGITGRGKTTLMYQMIIAYLMTYSDRMIISAEDPVEQVIPGIIQRAIQDTSYGAVIKSILRHRPDLIVIGEIRDEEAANGLVRALLTGHKVICTLHIIEEGFIYKNIINRMEELGVKGEYLKPYLKSAVLIKEKYEYETYSFE